MHPRRIILNTLDAILRDKLPSVVIVEEPTEALVDPPAIGYVSIREVSQDMDRTHTRNATLVKRALEVRIMILGRDPTERDNLSEAIEQGLAEVFTDPRSSVTMESGEFGRIQTGAKVPAFVLTMICNFSFQAEKGLPTS